MLTLDTPIQNLSRVGTTTARKLMKIGIATAGDLLFYFPYRYDDFTKTTLIKDLKGGMSANVIGQIELIQNRKSRQRRMYITEAIVNDSMESLKVIWFNQPFITKYLKLSDRISLAGKIDDGPGGMVMISPVYEKISGGAPIHTQGLVPNYHLTANITHKQIRFLIKQIIHLSGAVPEWLPAATKKNNQLLDLKTALAKIHFPHLNEDIVTAKKRLAFDELFLIQLESQLAKRELALSIAPIIKFQEKETAAFVKSLPFKLTDAQRKSAWEIIRDIGKIQPMARLLEGDVGSGKTLVACLAMLNVALNNKQSVLMVPTEILARQHYNTICRLFGKLPINIGLISGSQQQISNIQYPPRPVLGTEAISKQIQNPKSKTKIISKNAIFENSNIIIGTHALIQEDIKFKDLALAVIDEQHRFGVEQRKELVKKTGSDLMPHLLSMTATPIPRTLALALFGDLEISIIDEMPIGRKKIITSLVPESKREKAYRFIRDQIKTGRQVFVICPLIDDSDMLGVKSVETEFKKLDKEIFPDLPIGKLHGRMPAKGGSASGGKAQTKEQVMRDFLDNKIKILVSTSVIEVGVDVPNATVMMIEGADRFGLAQIHQFRGRVGRSEHQSYCFLFTDSDAPDTLRRLEALTKVNDGFELARIDLKFRGPGEVYGTMQKGFPELKIATLFDYQLMKQTKDEAKKLIEEDSTLNKWPELAKKLGNWQNKIHPE